MVATINVAVWLAFIASVAIIILGIVNTTKYRKDKDKRFKANKTILLGAGGLVVTYFIWVYVSSACNCI